MTTITKNVAAKLAVAFVAVAMALSAFAPVQAQTTEELQAMINDLLAQVAALQAGTGQGATNVASGVCPFTWTRDLSQGSTGADVMKLQQFLNADPDTRVAASGAGSVGAETQYYGPATAAAVSKMQVKYRADILSPAGLVNPTGYFGPSSRAKANSLCVTAPVVTPPADEDDEEEEETPSKRTLSGEASLDAFEIDSAEDDEVEEGAEDAPVAELTFEFTNGDAEISRIDIQASSSAGSFETDPWDVFDTFQLWVDGDMIAEKAADDEDDYLDEDAGTFRFSNLKLFAEEDEELEIVLAVTLQDNLDGLPESWEFSVESIRFFDADGVATTENSGLDFGDAVTVTIEEQGYEDELIVKTSSSDPDASTLQLEDDRKSDWYTLFVFDIDTDDSINDIELDSIPVTVAVSSSTVGAIVDDLELVIDGTTIDDFSWGTDGATRVATFDVDGDVVIDAGDRVKAELMVRFRSLALGNEGITASGSITAANVNAISAEGADDLTNTPTDQLRGSAFGDDHTLRTTGINVSPEGTSAVVTTQDGNTNDYATYTIEVEVTAFEQDVFLSTNPATSTTWSLRDGSGNLVSVGTSTAVLTSNATENGGYYELNEGETKTFTLTVTFVPGVANTAARLRLDAMNFAETATTPDQTQTTLPVTDYRTSVVTIVN